MNGSEINYRASVHDALYFILIGIESDGMLTTCQQYISNSFRTMHVIQAKHKIFGSFRARTM